MAAASAAAATGGALACIGLENPSRSSAQAAQKSRAWQTKLSQAARKARPAWHWLRSSFPAIQQLLTSRYNCSFYHSLMWAAGRCVCFCTCSETCTAPCHHPARCRLAAATPMHTLEQKTHRLRALFVGASRRSLFKLLQHQLTHASRGPGHFKRGAGPDPRGCWAARGEGCCLLANSSRRRRCPAGLWSCWGTSSAAAATSGICNTNPAAPQIRLPCRLRPPRWPLHPAQLGRQHISRQLLHWAPRWCRWRRHVRLPLRPRQT